VTILNDKDEIFLTEFFNSILSGIIRITWQYCIFIIPDHSWQLLTIPPHSSSVFIISLASFWLFSCWEKNSAFTIINSWVNIYSKSEYEKLIWINLVWVTINNLSNPRIDRWPFRTIVPISFADISQCAIKLQQVAPAFTQFTKLDQIARHEWLWWKRSQIRWNRKLIVHIRAGI
jgi:hypothetical protein